MTPVNRSKPFWELNLNPITMIKENEPYNVQSEREKYYMDYGNKR